jgi:hypothetical protein
MSPAATQLSLELPGAGHLETHTLLLYLNLQIQYREDSRNK